MEDLYLTLMRKIPATSAEDPEARYRRVRKSLDIYGVKVADLPARTQKQMMSIERDGLGFLRYEEVFKNPIPPADAFLISKSTTNPLQTKQGESKNSWLNRGFEVFRKAWKK